MVWGIKTRTHLDIYLSSIVCFFQITPTGYARGSHSEVSLGKDALKIWSKFTGEHPCRSVILIKLLYNFIEITLWHGCSPVNLLQIFRTPFLKNTPSWLLLICPIKWENFHAWSHGQYFSTHRFLDIYSQSLIFVKNLILNIVNDMQRSQAKMEITMVTVSQKSHLASHQQTRCFFSEVYGWLLITLYVVSFPI